MYDQTFDNNDPDFNEENAKKIGSIAGEQLASSLTGMGLSIVSGLVTSAILSLIVTNYHKESLTGDEELSPTKDENSLESKEMSGAKQDSKASQEEFKAQNGDVTAAKTDGKVLQTNSHVTKADTNAVNTQAGTIDTSAKGMKIN